jgi:hypothetical protein
MVIECQSGMKQPWIPLLIVVGLALTSGVGLARAGTDPETKLAEKYAPVVRLVKQNAPCGHGEPYDPSNVDIVLGNPEVALRGPWTGSNLVKVAPTALDLSKGLFGYNLDFPGDALSPGCTYEQWAQLISAGSAPTTYARVVGDPRYPGQLALQYWFFYVFNDYNDKHEGDWEMIQLDFRASNAQEALARTPTEVGYSQHGGAERAAWDDGKLQRVGGTHPVVYPAAGSHANYYRPGLYLGRSAAEGVGCDDTVGPSRQLRPAVAVVPTNTSAYLAAYPWLGYEGRWGEEHPGFYNGPTGPNTKEQWTAPITWADTSWRDSSYTVPEGTSVGTGATDFFCGAVAAGSNLLTSFVNNPWPVVIGLGALVILLLWLASRTQWGEGAPLRLRRRRPWGSLITSGWWMYANHLRLFLGIGLLFIPLGLIISGVQYLIFRVGGLSDLVDTVGASNAFVVLPALSLGLVLTLLGLTIAQAVSALAMVEMDEGRTITSLGAYRLAGRRIQPLVTALLTAAIAVALLSLTVVGLPFAIWLLVRWSLLAQVVALEEHPAHGALRRSARLVRRRWPRTASIALLVAGVGLMLGPLVGTLMLLLTSASFAFVNVLAGLIYVFTLPFVAVVTTYLYFDLVVREHLAPERPVRREILPAEI